MKPCTWNSVMHMTELGQETMWSPTVHMASSLGQTVFRPLPLGFACRPKNYSASLAILFTMADIKVKASYYMMTK